MRTPAVASKKVASLVLTAALAAALVLWSAPVLLGAPSQAVNDKVKTKFKANCVSCHGQDGAGTALGKTMQAPDLRSEQVQKHSDAELVQFIAGGKGDMPSFKNSLNEEEIRSLVQYIRGLTKKKEPQSLK